MTASGWLPFHAAGTAWLRSLQAGQSARPWLGSCVAGAAGKDQGTIPLPLFPGPFTPPIYPHLLCTCSETTAGQMASRSLTSARCTSKSRPRQAMAALTFRQDACACRGCVAGEEEGGRGCGGGRGRALVAKPRAGTHGEAAKAAPARLDVGALEEGRDVGQHAQHPLQALQSRSEHQHRRGFRRCLGGATLPLPPLDDRTGRSPLAAAACCRLGSKGLRGLQAPRAALGPGRERSGAQDVRGGALPQLCQDVFPRPEAVAVVVVGPQLRACRCLRLDHSPAARLDQSPAARRRGAGIAANRLRRPIPGPLHSHRLQLGCSWRWSARTVHGQGPAMASLPSQS